MELVFIVIILALIQYFIYGGLVGRARGKYNCPAPATSGDPVFERYFRVHANTAELLLMFIPAMLMYGYLGDPRVAAVAGLVYIVGRILYLQGYVADPAKRSAGFAVSFLPIAFLLLGSLFLAIRNLF